MSFDFSLAGQNSVSQTTIDFLESLPADSNIRIVGLMDRPENLNNSPYRYIIPLLDDYVKHGNGKVTVDYVNPETYPSILKELDRENIYDLKSDQFAVSYNGKIIVVEPYDCFTYDQNYISSGYMIPTANAVEYAFTNAIANVTSGFSAKAYFITGIQTDESAQLKHILSSLGFEAADLPVSDSFEIPEDCDILFINNPQTDIPEKVMNALSNYIDNGGDFIVAVNFYNNVAESYPRLNNVLNKMNLNIDPYVIRENDPSYALDNTGFASLVTRADSYTQFTSSAQLRSSYARPVRAYDNPYSYIKTDVVLTTSEKATAVQIDANNQISQYENESTYNVAMYATYEGMTDAPCCYVFGTSDFTSDSYISSYGYNDANVQFIRNCIKDVSGMDQYNSLVIATKPLDDYSIDTTKVTSTNVSVMTIVFMVVIPLALVIAATIVYNKRKNL
ncbi:MAG: GldG family protein [Clostridiales bacterium]|nr:GldG family protein [Clostridiales bacterium]